MLSNKFHKIFLIQMTVLFLIADIWGIGDCQGAETYLNENEHLQSESDCLILTLSSAISRALNCNRQLLGTVESLTYAQYGIDLAKSEFNISITPNGQGGYLGGDRCNPGWTIGGG